METHLLSIEVLQVSVLDPSHWLDRASGLLSGTSSLISITHTQHIQSVINLIQILTLTWSILKCSGTH